MAPISISRIITNNKANKNKNNSILKRKSTPELKNTNTIKKPKIKTTKKTIESNKEFLSELLDSEKKSIENYIQRNSEENYVRNEKKYEKSKNKNFLPRA